MESSGDLIGRLAALIHEQSYQPQRLEQLVAALGLEDAQEGAVREALKQMEKQGLVLRTRSGRYGAPEKMNLVLGRLQGHAKGFAFLIPDDRTREDIYIGRESLSGAWHGDRVIVRPSAGAGSPGGPGNRVTGEVIRILERANARVVGTFQWTGEHAGFVTPDEKRLPEDILIPNPQRELMNGETVLVEITRWAEARRNAEGQVRERIGFKTDPGVDVVAIIKRYGLPTEFPSDVLAEAEAIPDHVRAEDAASRGREDLRELPMVTIDGEDAKDLDDAVSLELTERGYRLGVHIADVSYYVREGSALDREARERATSVYLVDRVLPMLPQRLSNGICSLNPQVDRLALSVIMDYDADGHPLSHRITRSVIRTNERMTYRNVARILVDRDPELIERYRPLVPMFEAMERLCRILRQRRFRRGSIDFDLAEEKVILDERGKPVEIRPAVRTVADQMIEEFMLRANETVAETFFHRDVPFLYRIHEEPALDKLEALAEFLHNFGFTLHPTKVRPKTLQEILNKIQGRPEEKLLNTVILRSLKQARYSADNVGHFGLAAPFYSHFTSPIRRYPDLVIHRIITDLMEGRWSAKAEERLQKQLPEIATHCSEQERRAEEAERDTVELKKAQFMLDKIGAEFDGIISGVTNFGLFVEMENTVEGLVHVSHLTDDYYTYVEKQYSLIGNRTRKVFRLGDPVRVRVLHVDVETRTVDLMLAGVESEPVGPARGRGRGTARKGRRPALQPVPVAATEAGGLPEAKGKGRGGRRGRRGERQRR